MKNLIFFSCYFAAYLFAQSTYMPKSVLSSGSVRSESDQAQLIGTIGQVFTSKLVSSNNLLASGFWGGMFQITLGIDELLPEQFSISNAYPNPFNPTINIDISIPEKTDVKIQVYDLLGKNVFTHQQDFTSPGKYRFQWNATDNNGNSVASGIYIVAVQHKKKFYKQKITFLK